jgi:hypothetical protein
MIISSSSETSKSFSSAITSEALSTPLIIKDFSSFFFDFSSFFSAILFFMFTKRFRKKFERDILNILM